MKADLHMHSNFSDGKMEALDLIKYCEKKGLNVISITDHDNILSHKINYEGSLKIIKGIELSTKRNNESVHVLGYFRENSDLRELEAYLEMMEKSRIERALKIISLLKEHFDIDITLDDFENYKGVIARPHIAKAIIKKGYDYTINEIFEKMIGDDCPCYVPSSDLKTEDGLALLKRANALTVLAHPVLLKKNDYHDVLALGFDGVEAIYPLNTLGFERKLREEYDGKLIFTAGSDFHGDTMHKDVADVVLDGYETKLFLDKLANK